MSFLGRTPSNAPLTTADIPDGIIVAADLAPNSVDSSELVDGSIDTSHIADNQVTLAKMAGGTDGNLITYDTSGDPAYVATGTSGHVLTSAGADAVPAFAAVPAGGITHASQWRVNAGFAGSAAPIGGSGLGGDGAWEEVDAPVGFGIIGASMTETDGIFTFPVTGYWLIDFKPRGRGNGGVDRMYGEIYTTTGVGGYLTTGVGETWLSHDQDFSTTYTNYIFHVTSTSTHFVQFRLVQGTSSNTFAANDTNHYNSVSFIRLG